MTDSVPSVLSVLATLIGVTWRRLVRGRALWVTALIALLPTAVAAAMQTRAGIVSATAVVVIVVMALLPCVFVAASIGEEIEDRTTTYLWSRPLPRWTVIVSKLLALAPIAALMVAGSWVLALQFGASELPTLRSTLAFGAGAVAVAFAAGGIATLVPRHGMALSIVYIVFIDSIIGAIPASLRTISITWQVVLLSGVDDEAPRGLVAPAVTLAVLALVWLVIGLVRLRRLES